MGTEEREALDQRFGLVFAHLGLVRAYIRRRGGRDPDSLAADVMAIAWRRLADVPQDDPRPWLITTARNLLLADWRRQQREQRALNDTSVPVAVPAIAAFGLDPPLEAALLALPARDREALLLIAWEDLTPAMAAASLGVSPTAFRARLYRARRRLAKALTAKPDAQRGLEATPRSING